MAEETIIKCPYQTGFFPNTYGTIDIKLPISVSLDVKEDITAYELAILLTLNSMALRDQYFYSEEELDKWLSDYKIQLAKRHLVIKTN